MDVLPVRAGSRRVFGKRLKQPEILA